MGIGLLLLGQPAPETLADNSSAQGKPIKSQRPPLPLQEGLHMLHHIHLSASHRDREPRSLQYGTLCQDSLVTVMFQEATQQLLAGNKVSIAQQATSQGTAAEMSVPLEM